MPPVNRDLDSVLRQIRIPTVIRGGPVAPLIVRLPFRSDNRSWLSALGRKRPLWLATETAWGIPKSWFEPLIQHCLARFAKCYVIQPTNRAETCAPACWNARGVHCECSCLGARHGSGDPEGRWHIVSETFAVRIGRREFSCRLLAGLGRQQF